MPNYLRFIGNPASAPGLNRKRIGGNREAVIRAFELYGQMFPTLSEVFYSSPYTAIFLPLFMKKSERAVEFYREYLHLLQEEFLELIAFCFDRDFCPGVLGSLHSSERYSLWCKIRKRSARYKRQETFEADLFSPHGTKRPYGLSWEELDAAFRREIILTDEQKAFAKEFGIDVCELEARYHYPSFIGTFYECSTIQDCCIWNFPSCWRKGYNFRNVDVVGGTLYQRAIITDNTVTVTLVLCAGSFRPQNLTPEALPPLKNP